MVPVQCLPLVLCLGSLIKLIVCSTEEKTTVINTSFGPIEGQQFLSEWSKQIVYSFKGIPYASAPVGDLRFKDPVPPKKWTQVRDCTIHGPICPQILAMSNSETNLMDEDCLYLNVYSPQLPSQERKPALPVILWIHGGGFYKWSGNYDAYGPDLLIAEKVVMVTLNYRLGALGFLNMDVQDAPGNAGLKDQRLALLWIQSEIHNFGGDPHQVTIFGESAGAISAHLHYISPISSGLFHRIIGDSGSPLAYRVREDNRHYAEELAKLLNCPHENTSKVLSCLRTAPYEDIVRAQGLVKAPQDSKTGLNVWTPTIDKTSPSPLLPEFPYKLLKQKKDFFVPVLMGINDGEGIDRFSNQNEETIKNIINDLEYLYALQVPEAKLCPSELKAEKLRQFYFKDASPSEVHARGYVDIYTDVLYAYGSVVNAREYQTRSSVFVYYFTFSGRFKNEFIEQIQRKYDISGVSHTEELNYLFINEDNRKTLEENSNEYITRRRMVKMWTNFAKHGTPTIGPDPLLQNVHWLPAKKGGTNHLQIDVNLTMISEDLLPHRAALWDDITFNHCSNHFHDLL
ncbi:esterase B1-like [Macrosteles quadrilineatus]|uniref:esterase B1-like n=1 Tax=Macrosteles quadrilineatus TaxID=74068 RepID=UPI0023E102A8|nr:esterase B1-like [Macrosteles quadrilineatus]